MKPHDMQQGNINWGSCLHAIKLLVDLLHVFVIGDQLPHN
jgi:hypothetical protein